MRRFALPILVLLAACGAKEPAAPEKTYPMTATIVSRDVRANTVNLDNKEIPGVMEAMKMDYALRGAKAETLPPNGTPIECTLHQQDDAYWITDVKAKK